MSKNSTKITITPKKKLKIFKKKKTTESDIVYLSELIKLIKGDCL